MGILRGIASDSIPNIAKACLSSGLKVIEITMNTPSASKLISQVREHSKDNLNVGAGTVLTLNQAQEAIDSGAEFIVSPTLIEEVVNFCRKKEIPVFPGAFSPQEIYRAWLAGATMVKVFPAGLLGSKYIKAIKGPFNEIELLACGGVNYQNLAEYFNAGVSAVAFGGSIFKKDLLKEEGLATVASSIKKMIVAYKKIYAS